MLDYSLKDWNLMLIIYTSYFFASLYGFFFFWLLYFVLDCQFDFLWDSVGRLELRKLC